MTRLSQSLQFYVKHTSDVSALWGEDEKPDGVAPEEWDLFKEVLEETKSDADALLRRLSAPLESGLIKGFSVIGRKPKNLREYWDYYRQFKRDGKGNHGATGYASVQIVDESGGTLFMIVYVSAYPSGRPEPPDGILDRCPDKLRAILADKLVVAAVQLTVETEEETLMKTVVDSVPAIIAVLGSMAAK